MAADGSLTFDTKVDTKGFQTGTNSMTTMANKAKVGVTAAITACVAALAKFVKSSIETGSEFDAAMSQVAATMGTTKDQISDLTDKAKEMGSTTAFTATEAAEGLNILAQAGYDATEQCEMIEPVLNLAAAGATTMDSAASYLTTTLKGYCVSSEETGEMTEYYADLMAKGATMVNTSVDELGEAMSRSAATSNAYGQEVETTTTALLAMADGGITGSQAANYLARMMSNLYAPTSAAKSAMEELTEQTGINCKAYDEDTGQTRDFMEIVESLSEATSQLSEEEANQYIQTIMGTVGLKGYNAITTKTTSQLNAMKDELTDCTGAAQDMADTQLDNLQGDMTLLNSAVDGLKIQLFETLDGPLRGIVQFATNTIIPCISKVLGWVQTGMSKLKEMWQEEETEAGNLKAEMEDLDGTIDDTNDLFEETRANNAETVETYRSMADELDKLSQQTNLTSSQQERMNYIVGEFQAAGLDVSYDEATHSIEGGTDAIHDYCDAMEDELEYNTAVEEMNELLGEKAELERICADAEVIMSGETEATYGEMYKANQAYEQAQADLEALNVQIDECSSYIDEMGDAMGETSEETDSATGRMQADVDQMIKDISGLDDEYQEVYDSALESLEGQFDLWEDVGDVVTTSVEDIMSGLESQEKYYAEYADNMENLNNRQIDGLDELVAAYSDGSMESAGYIASMAEMSDEELEAMIAEMQKVSDQQARVADDAAEASTHYTEVVTEKVGEVVDEYDRLDMHDEVVGYTEETMGGVAETIENEEGEIEEALYSVSDKGGEIIEDSLNGMTEDVAESMDVATTECADALEEVVTLSSEAEGEIEGSVTAMAGTILELTTSYQDVYDAAYESMSGQFDLWEEAGEVSITSMEDLQSALDSQQQYWEDLSSNIEMLSNSGIDGMDQLLASIDTTSTDGVAYIASLAAGLGDSSFDMQAYVDQATQGMSGSWQEAATSVAGSTAAYEGSVEEAITACVSEINELDQGSEAHEYAVQTLQGYVDGLGDGDDVSDEILAIAQEICEQFADELDIHSPSGVFEDYGEDTTAGYVNGISNMSSEVDSELSDTLDVVSKWGSDTAKEALDGASEAVKNVDSSMKDMPGTVEGHLDTALKNTVTWGTDSKNEATNTAKDFISNTKNGLSGIGDTVSQQLEKATKQVNSWQEMMKTKASAIGAGFMNNLTSGMSGIGGAVASKLSDVSSRVNSWNSQMYNSFYSVGRNMMVGLQNGVSSMINSLYSYIYNQMSGLVRQAENALGIHSPSRRFRDEVGKQIPPGISEGFEDAMPALVKDTKAEMAELTRQMQAAVDQEAGKISLDRGASANYAAQTQALALASGGEDMQPYEINAEIHTHVELDGKEVGNVTTPFIDANFAREDTKKRRGG